MSDKIYTRCLRCGRKLKNPEHMKVGFGPSCYKKINHSRLKMKKSLLGVEYDGKTRKISN